MVLFNQTDSPHLGLIITGIIFLSILIRVWKDRKKPASKYREIWYEEEDLFEDYDSTDID